MGIISPVGSRVDDAWKNVRDGVSGISLVDDFDTTALSTRIGGQVKDFSVDDYLSTKEARKIDPFMHYGIAASVNAIEDSGFEITDENSHTIGIAMGAGMGGIKTIEDNHNKRATGTREHTWPAALTPPLKARARNRLKVCSATTKRRRRANAAA
jgi:3-oxoacyl-[acyl-carrier-protein] synthase II